MKFTFRFNNMTKILQQHIQLNVQQFLCLLPTQYTLTLSSASQIQCFFFATDKLHCKDNIRAFCAANPRACAMTRQWNILNILSQICKFEKKCLEYLLVTYSFLVIITQNCITMK